MKALIIASAPERESEIEKIWSRHGLSFHMVADSKGFKMEGGGFGAVYFNARTIYQIWLLMHAAFKSLYAYGDFVFKYRNSGLKFLEAHLSSFCALQAEHAKFDDIIDEVIVLNNLHDATDFHWPNNLYNPLRGVPPAFMGSEPRAVYDLICIGMAFVYLHEVKHVVNIGTKASFPNSQAEELGCDEFAIAILMDKVDEYADAENYPKKDVIFKRASAIAISLFMTAVISESAKQDNGSHPSFKARIMQLIGIVALDDDSFFWVLMVCLLMSYMRKVLGVNAEVELISAKEACIRLIGKL